ncbi:MAG TPA: hypothetical protein VHE58_10150 [Burkholderiales bacterium]|nr:hypothetical protein [Burkholderiales bacterium]
MPELSPEVAGLLKELRTFLANGSEPWEQRRELIQKINNMVEGGEVELFVGMAREMSRIGATYTNLLQAFAQFGAAQQGGANLADWFTRSFQQPQAMVPPLMSPAAGFDYFKQLADFMSAQAKSAGASQEKKD